MMKRNEDTPMTPSPDPLDQAIHAWRHAAKATPSRLSEGSRRTIVAAVREDRRRGETTLPSMRVLFLPIRRLALAGVAPLLMLTMGLGYLMMSGVSPTSPEVAHQLNLEVSKINGEVVFEIANGSTTHTIHISNAPDNFDGAAGVSTTDGSFRDALHSGGRLVFYRIESIGQ